MFNVDGALSDEVRPPYQFDTFDVLAGVAVADLDGDERAEILVTTLSSNQVFVLGYLD